MSKKPSEVDKLTEMTRKKEEELADLINDIGVQAALGEIELLRHRVALQKVREMLCFVMREHPERMAQAMDLVPNMYSLMQELNASLRALRRTKEDRNLDLR